MGEHDDFAGRDKVAALEQYPAAHHAFFNDTRPEVYDEAAAKQAWARTVDFFRDRLV